MRPAGLEPALQRCATSNPGSQPPGDGATVPPATVVAGGAPEALPNLVESACLARPLVVICDSGGAAGAIYQFCTSGIEAVAEEFRAQEGALAMMVALNGEHGGSGASIPGAH